MQIWAPSGRLSPSLVGLEWKVASRVYAGFRVSGLGGYEIWASGGTQGFGGHVLGPPYVGPALRAVGFRAPTVLMRRIADLPARVYGL